MHVLVRLLPLHRPGDLELLEVKSVLPVNFVGMASDEGDGPGVGRVKLWLEGDYCVVLSSVEVVNLCLRSTLVPFCPVNLQDLHVHVLKDGCCVVVENEATQLGGRFAQDAIVNFCINLAFRLSIVLPIRCGPGFGTQTS